MANGKPGRPPIPDYKRRPTLAVRVDPKTKRWLAQHAHREKISIGRMIDALVDAQR